MFRICLCLLIAVASTTVAAREIKLSSPNGGGCPDTEVDRDATRGAVRGAAPARGGKAKPSVHSDAGSDNRLQSPRWHSFLPGMFR